jgi:hypothetical protein
LTEAAFEQVFRPRRRVRGLDLVGAEPGWQARPVLSGAKAGLRSTEDGHDLFLGQPLDQAV